MRFIFKVLDVVWSLSGIGVCTYYEKAVQTKRSALAGPTLPLRVSNPFGPTAKILYKRVPVRLKHPYVYSVHIYIYI